MQLSVNMLLSLIAGLATAIPLVIKLVQYVQKAAKEKNWTAMIELLMKLMAQAETNFSTGAKRKAWVLSEIQAAAAAIRYDIDMDAVSALIDDLCSMARQVNAPEDSDTK